MKAIQYVLTKRYKAFLITESIIICLFILKVIGKLEADFVLSSMMYIQIVGVGYIGSQTVSDIMREYKSNEV